MWSNDGTVHYCCLPVSANAVLHAGQNLKIGESVILLTTGTTFQLSQFLTQCMICVILINLLLGWEHYKPACLNVLSDRLTMDPPLAPLSSSGMFNENSGCLGTETKYSSILFSTIDILASNHGATSKTC